MKIVFIDQNFNSKKVGGAFKSNFALIKEFSNVPDFNISVLARNTGECKSEKLNVMQIKPIFTFPFKKMNSLLDFLRINQNLSFFQIFIKLNRIKPDIIIVQRDLTLATLIAAFLLKVKVINVIRDPMELCPKHIDIIDIRNNCLEVLSRKRCWSCIDRWRTLRIRLQDKPLKWNETWSAIFFTLFYKLRFYFVKLYVFFSKRIALNLVASPLMKEYVFNKIRKENILVKRLTPIDDKPVIVSKEVKSEEILKKIENLHNILLYVLPRNESGSKGYPFVKLLIEKLPKNYNFVIVGTTVNELKKFDNVINLDKVTTDILYNLYKKADLTIVPSIYTEAFGRVILESIKNKTPVMMSPQCGASYLFKDKEYAKVIPLNINIWIEEIQNFFKKPFKINEANIDFIRRDFSSKTCANELINLINKLVMLKQNKFKSK